MKDFLPVTLFQVAVVAITLNVAAMVGCDTKPKIASETTPAGRAASKIEPAMKRDGDESSRPTSAPVSPEPTDQAADSGVEMAMPGEQVVEQAGTTAMESAMQKTVLPSEMSESGQEPEPSQNSDSGESTDDKVAAEMGDEPPRDDSEVPSDPLETSPVPHYRLWLPTTQGPLLVGLEVWVGEVPLKEVFQNRINGIVEELKESETDSVSWDELIDHVASNAEVFGQSSAQVSGQKANLKKRYDRNKNGTAERGELVKFVFRDSRFENEFRLFGTDAFRWGNRSQSLLFAAIDRDKNRKLDASEIDQAGFSMTQQLDSNADGCIDHSEATSLSTFVDDNAWGYRRSHRQGEVAMDLSGYVNWSNLAFAAGGMFGPVDFLKSQDVVSSLDEDGDERISQQEVKTLLGQGPAVTLVLRWPSADSSAQTSAPDVQWVIDADQTDAIVQVSSGNTPPWVATESFQFAVTTDEQVTRSNVVPREAFDQLDANKDGGLDETEIPDGAEEILSLESKDADGDGKLSYDEIIKEPAKPKSIWAAQVRARGAEHPQAVFAWLDTDHDLLLSARELAAASSRLHERLAGQKSLTSKDLPDTFLLQFVRGEPNQDESRFTLRRQEQPVTGKLPRWAAQMDSNRDGDISQNEFPGRIEQFEKLDQNADGFLDRDEIDLK